MKIKASFQKHSKTPAEKPLKNDITYIWSCLNHVHVCLRIFFKTHNIHIQLYDCLLKIKTLLEKCILKLFNEITN